MLSGISLPHILLLLLVVVLVFGTSKLKNLGKDLGGAIKGFKESMRDADSGDKAGIPSAQLQQQQTPEQQPPAQTQRSEQHDNKPAQ